MKTKNYFLTIMIAFSSIVSTYFVTVSTAQQAQQTVILKAADNEYLVAAVLYQQRAAEYRALAFQAFNTAKMSLDNDLKDKELKDVAKEERGKPRAVIVDIDETVLDNSPHQAFLVKNQLLYNSTTWEEWVKLEKAKEVPGAVEFLQYANDKKVKVFYVSNRADSLKQETMKNLTDLKFPDVSAETVMLQTDPKNSSKQMRRDTIDKSYRVVLLIGDNLDDFTANYEGKKSVDDRFSAAQQDKNLFGTKYIVLPNAMYGTWERATYNYSNSLTDCEKNKIQKDQLESYR